MYIAGWWMTMETKGEDDKEFEEDMIHFGSRECQLMIKLSISCSPTLFTLFEHSSPPKNTLSRLLSSSLTAATTTS